MTNFEGSMGDSRYDVAKFDAIERAMGQSPTDTAIDVTDTKLGPEFEAHYSKGKLGEPNPLGAGPLKTQGDLDTPEDKFDGRAPVTGATVGISES